MRKFIIISFFVLALLVVPFITSAQTEVFYPSLPGVLSPQDIVREAETEAEIFPLFMAYLFRLILAVSVLVVIGVVAYGGLIYILSSGNPIRTKIAREWILSAIQGALVIFSSYILLFALDSQLVLFELRDLDKTEKMETVDLEWEISNVYFQIPLGLLIEDAILNENALNKFYDVLDATNEAEAVAEAIYQGSAQLLSVVYQMAAACPSGAPCDGMRPPPPINVPSVPFVPASPVGRTSSGYVPPPSDPPAHTYITPFDEHQASLPFEKKTPATQSLLENTTEKHHQVKTTSPLYPLLSYFSSLFNEARKTGKEEANPDRERNVNLGAGETVGLFKEGFLDRDPLNTPTLLGKSLSSLFASFFELFKVGYIGAADYIIDMPDMDDWLDGDETGNDIEEHIVLPPNGDSGGDVDSDDPEGAFQDVSGANGDEGAHATSETQEGYYTEEGGGTITDEDGNEYNVDEGGGTITDEDGNEYNVDEDGNITDEDGNEYVMDEDGNIVPVDEEEEEEVVVCTRCPEIQPPIAGKIGEIEGYMATFRARLGNLFDTKEPLEEDLYQLHKATMIKTLGKESIIDYTSLILQRRYYERDEIVIRSDTSRTEIGNYFWDWGQWIHNILYRVRANGKIIEENDPVTFYLRDQDPRTSTVIADATTLSLGAQMEGIQDAGEQMGVSRIIPPPPPDIGTTLYSPVNPDNTRITSPYGWRTDPFTGEGTMHYGIDFAGPRGTPIYASEDGEVVFAGWSGTETSGYGKLLVLYHEATEENDLNQDIVTYYAHLDHNSLQVDEGDSVRRGDYIAGMGTTGRSTGYHLHYEVRTGVSYPYIFPTGDQVNPAPYIDIEQWSLADSSSFAKNDDEKSSLLQSLLKRVCIGSVSAQSDLEILNEYLIENNIDPRDLTEDEFNEILDELGILPDDISVFSPGDVDVKRPRDYLVCGMEIPVGETLELTWNHLVKILDTIDYYIAEGERMLQQQATMNSLAASCECPCGGSDPDCPGRCQLNCPLGAIAAAHANVAATREVLREIADYIRLLTHGHFNTPTEDVCHYLNEDIRSEEEETICQGGGSKLITNHELITRKLNYSRYSLDECITRPEHLEDVLEGTRAGKIPLFGPIVEKQMLPRYTKTKENGIVVNTSDLNWFCCSDERLEDK